MTPTIDIKLTVKHEPSEIELKILHERLETWATEFALEQVNLDTKTATFCVESDTAMSMTDSDTEAIP